LLKKPVDVAVLTRLKAQMIRIARRQICTD
jgi:hypothetical protein